VRVRPAGSRSHQRERIHDRPGARLEMEAVEAAQHRFGVRPHRRRVGQHRRGPVGHLVRSTPVGARRLARHQHPATEVACFDAGGAVPRDFDRPQEPEPAQQAQAVERIVAAERPTACKSRKKTDTASTGSPDGSTSRYGSHGSSVSCSEPVNGTANIARPRAFSSSPITSRTITK
jgi:hypothetical protein